MINYWFISDTHFNDDKILNFKNYDGSKLRDFKSVEEMNETIIGSWNSNVKPCDKVYHLGDVIFGNKKDYDKILSSLNGKKRLILGNHDEPNEKYLRPYFKKISGVKPMCINGFKCVLSHVPLHPDCLERFGINIHGHLHKNLINDERYYNVCVEITKYRLTSLEELLTIINNKMKERK